MFRLKTLTVKNFMSVGNATQAVNFDRRDLTLVLGVNIDLGGDDSGARNGTGKTTIINALSYALFGQALTNIRRDNLINKTNTKGMLVSLDFEHNGQNYKIERGRKKNVMRFFVGDQEQDITDMAQGDSRETQKAIEGMLGMSHEMFKHLVALNTYTQPFLTLRANDQKDIIEQLLGITMLSEKADALKERLKATKDGIKEEEYRIQAQQEANEKISDQIDSLKRRQTLWASKQSDDISSLETALEDLGKLDIEAELELHKDLKTWQELTAQVDQVDTAIQQAERDYRREETAMQKLQADIDLLQEHKCHACGQEVHDDKHGELLKQKQDSMQDARLQYDKHFSTHQALCEAKHELGDPGARPETYYEHAEDAYEHKNSLSQLQSQLQQRRTETDPYKEQIEEMEKTAGTEIDYEAMNALTRLRDHQEFLQKLLTNKDSFIRKRIIDQNLSYLNSRLSYYLDKIGLPHTVTFLSDLSVEIQELGRELDFDNLSRGERNRLILSLSWAFRDVYESLYDPINLLFIDELIDSGMDASGVESALALLKKMSREHKKSIWLVSHKDELAGRVNNIMTVTKENGFTTYGNDVDTV
ncbi:MAG: AAA family ATPase [Candidatus Poseidoniales archaeon]